MRRNAGSNSLSMTGEGRTPECGGLSVDRRRAVKMGIAALGGMALAGLAGGCSVLGIENPNDVATYDDVDPGAIELDGLDVQVNVESRYWQWSMVDDASSDLNGSLVVCVPVTAVNLGESTSVISDMYCKAFGPDGAQLVSLASRYADDIRNTGSIAVNASTMSKIYLPYCGAGTYTVQFDNLLGRKPSVALDIAYSADTGVAPFPTNLNGANVNASIPQGESFDVDGLTMSFATDTGMYVWTNVSAPGDDYWDGRGVVGIPLRVTNNSGKPMDFSTVAYRLYSSQTYQLSEGSWWFPDSVVNGLGTLAANQTARALVYFAYEYSECTCYCVFCHDGMPLVTAVWIP